MKQILSTLVIVFACGLAKAQTEKKEVNGGQTAKGKWLIESSTGFGTIHPSNTSFGLIFSPDLENVTWSIGSEAGYFIIDNLAIKGGLGYADYFSYKIGAKYYISSKIPVQLDYSGVFEQDYYGSVSYMGVQAGYAIFLGKNVSVEPGLRYNLDLDRQDNFFQLRVGFALHF
ncbi:MAG: hypothetical protein DI588_08365 [Flavobacterium johnsoniae]|nr:MAG: hypothetical protein DI588_08365 [Flavobacterium johnsoniae]